MMVDPSGNSPIGVVFAAIFGIAGWYFGDYVANQLGLSGWQYWTVRSAVAVGGAALGWFAGEFLGSIATKFLLSHPEILAKMPGFVLWFLGIESQGSGSEAVSNMIGILKEGILTPDGRVIETMINDTTKIQFYMDTGDYAHPIGNKYPTAVDHVNISFQTWNSSAGKWVNKWDMHLVLDKAGEVIDQIITGKWAK